MEPGSSIVAKIIPNCCTILDMKSSARHLVAIVFVTILSTLLIWLLFYFDVPSHLGFGHTSLKTLFANYDGPNYLVVSKCWYQKDCIRSHFSLPQPLEYYPAHLPGYPLLITLVSVVFPGPLAMLLATLAGSVVLNVVFYFFALHYLPRSKAFWLTLAFQFLPGRLFILRLIGAPETWFLAAILGSILLFSQKKYWLSALVVAMAQLFKSPAILLFAAYGLIGLTQIYQHKVTITQAICRYLPYLFVPLTALAIFAFYYLQTGDFLAYFHSGDNFHLNSLPYLTFISTSTWVNGIWLEDVLYIYLLALIAVTLLFKKYKIGLINLFPLVYTIATIFVAHRDISRYIAPVYPFIFLAFGRYLTAKWFRLILLLILPAVILYAVNFIIGNVAPVADWTPYL